MRLNFRQSRNRQQSSFAPSRLLRQPLFRAAFFLFCALAAFSLTAPDVQIDLPPQLATHARAQATFKIPYPFQAADLKLPKDEYRFAPKDAGHLTLRQESEDRVNRFKRTRFVKNTRVVNPLQQWMSYGPIRNPKRERSQCPGKRIAQMSHRSGEGESCQLSLLFTPFPFPLL